jgi:hypothetical protein
MMAEIFALSSISLSRSCPAFSKSCPRTAASLSLVTCGVVVASVRWRVGLVPSKTQRDSARAAAGGDTNRDSVAQLPP